MEMKRIYRGFKTECPTGLITEDVFHGIYSRFFPHGGNVISFVLNTLLLINTHKCFRGKSTLIIFLFPAGTKSGIKPLESKFKLFYGKCILFIEICFFDFFFVQVSSPISRCMFFRSTTRTLTAKRC